MGRRIDECLGDWRRNTHHFVILGRSKERSDAAQTQNPCRDFQAALRCKFCSAAPVSQGNGIDPRGLRDAAARLLRPEM